MKVIRQLLSFATPYRGMIGLGALLSTLTVYSNVGLMTFSAFLLSWSALAPTVLALMTTIGAVRFFGLSRAVFRYLERYINHRTTLNILAGIRVWLYQKIEKKNPGTLTSTGEDRLFSELTADVELLKDFYLRVLLPPLTAFLAMLGISAVLFWLKPHLAFVFIAFYLLIGIGIPLLNRYWYSRGSIAESNAALETELSDSLHGLTEILAYQRTEAQLSRVAKASAKLTSIKEHMAGKDALSSILTTFLSHLAALTMIILALPLVTEGRLEPVWFAALILGVLSSFEAAGPLAQVFPYWQESLAAGSHLLEYTSTEEETTSHPSFSIVDPILTEYRGINVEELSFTYPGMSRPALSNISFKLQPGKRVGIIGPSGSGKSTLIHLLLHYWDDYQGTICFNGQEIRDLSRDDLWAQIGVVSRQTHLFHATLRENLLLAKPEASDEELLAVLEKVRLLPLIQSLPEGLNSSIGEEGSKLSGGQRQLLAIARAFLKNSPLLLLDEATEGLVGETAEAVLGAIEQLMAGRTTLMVTHRLSDIRLADELIVLQEGVCIEQGSPEDLLKNEGLYHYLLELEKEGAVWLS